MHGRIKDLTGKKFGKLIVLNYSYSNRGSFWLCECDCGNQKIIRSGFLQKGQVQSCGCMQHPKREKTKRWRGLGEISGDFLSRLKTSAKSRNLEFSISLEYIWNLFISQNRKCALSGYILQFQTIDNLRDGTASLDRIDSSKGYIKGNVQWVHKEINRMKGTLKISDFKKLIEDIHMNLITIEKI